MTPEQTQVNSHNLRFRATLKALCNSGSFRLLYLHAQLPFLSVIVSSLVARPSSSVGGPDTYSQVYKDPFRAMLLYIDAYAHTPRQRLR